MSQIALGAWRFADEKLEGDAIRGLVEKCAEAGITTVDHADIYGGYACEGLFGAAVPPAVRDRLQLVTKCGIKLVSPKRPGNRAKIYDTSRAHVVASVENSLKELRTDRIDLLLIHRPDPLMDAEETARAFVELKDAGKVLNFGVSNFSVSQFELLASRLPFPLVTNQIEFSVLRREAMYDGTLDQCQRLRIAPMAWSPFGGGKLFSESAAGIERVREALRLVGKELGGATMEQVALAWILNHPSRPVGIIGTTKVDRALEAAKAGEIKLSRDQWFGIWKAATGTDLP